MRPLLVPSSYAPHVGGVEEVVARLAAGFAASGHHPAVLTNHWPRELPSREVINDIPVTRHAFRVPQRSVRGVLGFVTRAVPTRRAVIAHARAHRADVVNIHCVSSNAAYALAASRGVRAPLVVSLHGELGNDASDAYRRDQRLVRLWRGLIGVADAITAPSQFVLDEAQDFYGRAFGERATVIRNGVDVELFGGPRRPDARPFAFAVGRLVAPKGFDVLIEAWTRPGAPELDLVIGGDGPERPHLERLAAASGGRVRLVGNLDRAAVADHLARASVFVLPSHAEPLGLTVLEAMAARTPVVATAAGGVPELLGHARSGLLVAPGDPAALAAAVRAVVADVPAADARAAAAAGFAADLTWDACTQAYLDVYRGAADRATPRSGRR